MKTYYKVYSVGNDAQPSHISDSDGSVFIKRHQLPIGQFDSPMRYHLDKFHCIQKSQQEYSIDSEDTNTDSINILRRIIHNNSKSLTNIKPYVKKFYICQFEDILYDKIDIKKFIAKHYRLRHDICTDYIDIKRNNYGLIGIGSQQYSGLHKDYIIEFKSKTCYIINRFDDKITKQYDLIYKAWKCNNIYNLNYLYNTETYNFILKNNDARTRLVYPALSLTHIFKEYYCNSVYTPVTYWKNLGTDSIAHFRYKITAESTKQKSFTTNVVLIDKSDIEKDLASVSTNVIQKTDVVIDSSVGNVSLLIQKNEFFELKLNNVADIKDLPDGVSHKDNSIKGSISNSGEYYLNVTYNNNATQVINIIVPFYRRLL